MAVSDIVPVPGTRFEDTLESASPDLLPLRRLTSRLATFALGRVPNPTPLWPSRRTGPMRPYV
jgi:hypothetical protein